MIIKIDKQVSDKILALQKKKMQLCIEIDKEIEEIGKCLIDKLPYNEGDKVTIQVKYPEREMTAYIRRIRLFSDPFSTPVLAISFNKVTSAGIQSKHRVNEDVVNITHH